jgi:uncharacterized repeat protein (TIGR02543 family)
MVERNKLSVAAAIVCLLLLEAVSFGTDYYVDPVSGNNSYSGTSTGNAWRTIAKVNSSYFAPGDRVLFKRGGVWRESLMPVSSGVAGAPVTFGAYGTGAHPVIAGSDNLTSGAYAWQRSARGTNEYFCNASGLNLPDAVWLNGAYCAKGTAGALGDHQWAWANNDGLGFSTVYLRDDSGNPGTSGVLVEAAARGYSVYASGKSYLTFDSLEVRHADDNGYGFGVMYFLSCQNITIRNCIVHDISTTGIHFNGTGSANHLVQNNTLYNALPTWDFSCLLGVYHTTGMTISRNTIYNAIGAVSVGLTVQGSSSGVTVEQNNIYNCRGDHIYLRDYSSNNIIRHNYLHDGAGNGVMIRQGANNNKVYGNLIVEAGSGIAITDADGATSGNLVCNNTCYHQTNSSAPGIVVAGNHVGTQIRNNCVRTNSNCALYIDGAAAGAVSSNYNCLYNTSSFRLVYYNGTNYLPGNFASYVSASGQDTSSKMLDPLFVNPGARDFSLQSTSPCLNAGTALGTAVSADLARGSTWPNGVQTLDQYSYGPWEIGAYVYGSAPASSSYTLSVSATNGTVAKTPNQTSYTSGQSVTLQAVPNSGYTFTGWSGALTGTTNPATLVMDSNKSVTANFTATTTTTRYTLSVSASNGSVTRTPNQTSYTFGQTVTLQAIPNSGYTFTGWSGALTGTANPATLVMNSNKYVTAYFTGAASGTKYALSVTAPNGSVTRTPNQTTYAAGQTVTLQAVPNTGYVFTGWAGAVTGMTNPATLVMNANKSVLATFARATAATSAYSANALSETVALAAQTQPAPETASDSLESAGDVVTTDGPTQVRTEANEPALIASAPDAVPQYVFGPGRSICADQTDLVQGKPATVRDEQGSLWVVWQAGSPGQRQIYAARVQSDANTPGAPVQISQGAGDHCNPAVTLDWTGTFCAVWQEDARGVWNVSFSTSLDGRTWSAPTPVADSNSNQVNPAIAAGSQPTGLVAVAWQDDRAGNQDIYVARSMDALATVEVSAVTSDANDQTEPAVAIDGQDRTSVLWTDARNSSTDIYGATSDRGPWTNVPVTAGTSNQFHPALAAGATGSVLYLAWVDDIGGDTDIFYAASAGLPGSPLAGADLVDDKSKAEQQAPVVAAAAGTDGTERVYVCWQDGRGGAYRSGTRLYLADVSPGSVSTNLLVGDEAGSSQSDAALGADAHGNPYVVWTNENAKGRQVYYAGAAREDSASGAASKAPAAPYTAAPAQGAATLTDTSAPSEAVPLPLDEPSEPRASRGDS